MLKPAVQPLLALLAATLAVSANRAAAQYQRPEVGSMDQVIEPYQPGEVGVDEKLGTFIPLGDAFLDQDGQDVTLNTYLHKGRPIILWLGYYDCPMLCDRMSGGLVRAVRSLKLDSGKEFGIVQVSINPDEVPGLAKQKKENYLKELGQPGDAKGWDFLTGKPESIKALTDAVGYKFKAVKVNGETEYAHPAVLVVLSPEGKIARYLYPGTGAGVEFDSQTMRLSLIEASDGRVGSTVDQFLLTCLRWDAHTGKYTWVATQLMKYAGGLTVLIMAAVFIPLWIRSARRGSDNDSGAAPRGGLATR